MLSFAREDDHHHCAWFRNGPSFGKSRWLYTPAPLSGVNTACRAMVRSSGGDPSDARQLSALLRASPLLSQQVLQSRIVEHRVCQKPLQLRVFVLKCLQPLGFGHVHAAELGLPFIDAGIADAVLAAKLRDRRACRGGGAPTPFAGATPIGEMLTDLRFGLRRQSRSTCRSRALAADCASSGAGCG